MKKGDCLELLGGVQDMSIDLILCDLPYGTTRNKWDKIIDLDKLWEHYNRIIKDNGAIVLFSQQPFSSKLIESNPKMFRYERIWTKGLATGHLNAKKMPLKKHENILVFYKKLPTYNPQWWYSTPYKVKQGRSKSSNYDKQRPYTPSESKDGRRYPVDIIEFKHDGKKLHPTQKPVALLEYLIKTYTNEGDTVLDNCMGSGSTGVACANTNRNFIGIELSSEYYNIAKDRIEKAVAK
ncbi:DNA modification methylase (plasmid) [Ligilactobacillus salivarius]|uniref:Methyltransferase n=2 Tax=Ligilactobacillus salivarius TaxID=1624 RepID=A0A089QL99_9LACO|nr:DNA modification methylase [Ligilactobacillus salivarius]